jgi:hypothetical protein
VALSFAPAGYGVPEAVSSSYGYDVRTFLFVHQAQSTMKVVSSIIARDVGNSS